MATVGDGMIALGAGLAVGLSGVATGIAEKDIGAAAVGATAEKPEMFGRGLVLMVIPETIVLFGFVIAFLLMGSMGGGA
ncbi:MAG: ATPase [Candidatus Thermoplasmatota archaeon]|nr:ATPase [Candidatus Thermoplasmatota archaeon]